MRALGHRLDFEAPFRGAPQTVALIKKYALEAQGNPNVRLLAEEIVHNLGAKDYTSEIIAIYNFVCGHTRYMNDPRTVELVRRPERIVAELAAGKTPSLDCDDIVCLIVALALACGRETRICTVAFKTVYYNGEKQYSHVYCQVKEPRSSQWITLDPVAAEETRSMLGRIKEIKIWPVA